LNKEENNKTFKRRKTTQPRNNKMLKLKRKRLKDRRNPTQNLKGKEKTKENLKSIM
jgi:hypothetical protein